MKRTELTGNWTIRPVKGTGIPAAEYGPAAANAAAQDWEIRTDVPMSVLQAMLENGLIAGSESEYGLYVTSVCGIELIWSEENPHYWAFYINDEYAQTGVDSTEAEEGAVYLFKAE